MHGVILYAEALTFSKAENTWFHIFVDKLGIASECLAAVKRAWSVVTLKRHAT